MSASPPPDFSSSSSEEEEDLWSVQPVNASELLRHVLNNLRAHVQDNLNLRKLNTKLNGRDIDTFYPPPDYNSDAVEREARELLGMSVNVSNKRQKVTCRKDEGGFWGNQWCGGCAVQEELVLEGE